MGGKRRVPKRGEGTHGNMVRMRPSAIHVDHDLNMRARLYPAMPELREALGFDADDSSAKCTHSPENIEARLASFQRKGQVNAVTIYLTLTGDAFLVWGYLRHLAALLGEMRDKASIERGEAPTGLAACKFQVPGKLNCTLVTEPKLPADWLLLADQNVAENAETVELTPIDIATVLARYIAPTAAEGGFGLSHEDAGARMGYAKRTVLWYLSLLGLSPKNIMLVHTGELKPTVALRKRTKEGRGGSPGPRKGVSRANAKLALKYRATRPLPTTENLEPSEFEFFLEVLFGVTSLEDAVDETGNDLAPANVRALIEWLTPPSSLEKSTPKKPPPKQTPKGES